MAFKTVEQYNDDRYRNLFRLVNDKDSADVIFLYRSRNDMLECDVHYIKSATYSGYVHCCGEGCPACALKKADGSNVIRVQSKVFIPVYNIKKGKIEFWDRTMRFEPQFKKDVFDRCADPSEYVFKVTRHGVYNDTDTTYSIEPVGRNTYMSYDAILAKFNAKMPDYYENVVKSVSVSELMDMLQTRDSGSSTVTQDYIPTPRAGYQSSVPDTFVNAADAVGGAADLPDLPFIVDDDEDTDLPDPNL